MSPKSRSARRDEAVETRREQILEAASRVFAQKGYHRTTTREIAEAAGVAEGTIYNYFANKEDLLVAMLNHFSAEPPRGDEIAAAIKMPLRDALRAMFRNTVAEAKRNLAMAGTVYSEVLVNPAMRERYARQRLEPLAALLEQHLQSHAARGEARAVDIPLTVRIVMAAQMGLAMLLLLGDHTLEAASEDELTDALVELFYRGLARTEAAE